MPGAQGGWPWGVMEQGPGEGPRMSRAQLHTHKAQLLAQRSAPSLIVSSRLSYSSSHQALKTKVTAAVLARGLCCVLGGNGK